MNKNKDLTPYLDVMKKTGKNIIAFQNINIIKYPDTYSIYRIKLNRPFQEIVMANIHAVDEKEIQ
jgi:histidinol phosphatase-like PHP family hydrolase